MTKIYYSCHIDNDDSVIIKYRSNEKKYFGWKRKPGLATETLTLLAGARTIKYNYEPQEGRLSNVNDIADLILKGYSEKPRGVLATLCQWICNLYCKLTRQPTRQETLSILVDSVKKKSFNVDVPDKVKIQRDHQTAKNELQKKVDEKLITRNIARERIKAAKNNYDTLKARQSILEQSILEAKAGYESTIYKTSYKNMDSNKSIQEKLSVFRENLKNLNRVDPKFDEKWMEHVQNSKELLANQEELESLAKEIAQSKSLIELHEAAYLNECCEYHQLLQQQRELNEKIYQYDFSRLHAKEEKIKQKSAKKLAKIDGKIEKYKNISENCKTISRNLKD